MRASAGTAAAAQPPAPAPGSAHVYAARAAVRSIACRYRATRDRPRRVAIRPHLECRADAAATPTRTAPVRAVARGPVCVARVGVLSRVCFSRTLVT